MTGQHSETNKPQGGADRNRILVEDVFSDPINFYKSYREFPKHEKLVKESSFQNLFTDRPQTAKVSEKAINTSKDEPKQNTSDKVSDLVNCPICLDMIEEAMETPCCHNIFCEKCIIRTEVCPICTAEYNKFHLTPNIPMRRLINEIVIKCTNEQCEVQCTKANMEKHLESCLYQAVSCPNSPSCKNLIRKDLDEHINNECEFRIIDCILMCGTRIMLNELYDHIHRVCPKSLIPCKNNCGEVVERGELIYHVNSKCKNEVISCLYKQTLIYQNGCDIKLKRGDMPDHLAQCPFRVTKCTNVGCEVKIAFKDTQKHDAECKFKQISCRNNCGSTFERKFEDEHFDVCELQMIRCPYYEMGCKTEILRRENLTHLQSEAFNHSLLFIEGQNKKNEEINSLKTEMNKMKYDFTAKFDELFRLVNGNRREEETKSEGILEDPPAPSPQRIEKAQRSNFSIYYESEDQDLEDYNSDEFESDYSFGFKNF